MLRGRCLCGGIQYEIHGKVSAIDLCHCSYCRKASGSAFASNASIKTSEFRLVSGDELMNEYEASPGKLRSFCSRCGSPIHARLRSVPAFLRIRVGTLDDDPGSRPRGHYDVESKAPWYEIAEVVPLFDANGKPAGEGS